MTFYETDHSKLLHGMRHGFSIVGEHFTGKSTLLRFILKNILPTAQYVVDAENLKHLCKDGQNNVLVVNVELISTEEFSAAIAQTTSTVIPCFIASSTQPRIDWHGVCTFDVEFSIGHEYPVDKPFGRYYIKKQHVLSHQYDWFAAVPLEFSPGKLEPFDLTMLSRIEV